MTEVEVEDRIRLFSKNEVDGISEIEETLLSKLNLETKLDMYRDLLMHVQQRIYLQMKTLEERKDEIDHALGSLDTFIESNKGV